MKVERFALLLPGLNVGNRGFEGWTCIECLNLIAAVDIFIVRAPRLGYVHLSLHPWLPQQRFR